MVRNRRDEALEGLEDGVVEAGTDLFDRLIGAVGPGSIGEERHGEVALGVDPQRSAGIAEVPVGARGQVAAGLGWCGWCVPP